MGQNGKLLKEIEKGGELLSVTGFGRFTVAQFAYERPVPVDGNPLNVSTKRYIGTGLARQGEGDRWNDSVGRNIAISRAQKSVLKKVQGKQINSIFMG